MRPVLAPFLAVMLLVGGCGGSSTSSTSTTERRSPTTASASVPSSSTPPTTTTRSDVPLSTAPASTSTTPGVPTTSTTVPGSALSLDQILGQREAWVISNSDYTAYSIEPCWTRDPDGTPPYGIFQTDPVDRAAPIGAGDVFVCSIRTEPVGEPGNLLIAVLTDDGLVATQQSSSGENYLPFTAPQGLGCQEFIDLPDIAQWTDHDSYSDWGPGAAYRLVVAYWFVEGQPARMDPDGDGVPCEEVVAPEVIAAAWSGDFWQGLRILRRDGIGRHDFGADISVVMSWATDLFGAPTSPSPMAIESVVPNLMTICGDQVAAHWETPALDLYFAQWEFDEVGLVSCSGPVRLVAWGVGSYLGVDTSTGRTSPRLTTADGIGVGTTVAELIERDVDASFMQWSDGYVFPAGFYLDDPVPHEHIYGVLAWDWVRDLQAALNVHGYQLAVDGEAGPRTRAALEAYRIEHELPSSEAAILDLALEPDGDVQVASMASGHWPIEFNGCGALALMVWGC